MINNKYYTPDIEEFHLGFEYEHLHSIDNQWIKELISYNNRLACFQDYISTKQVRVKYLDQEDIESLGFSLDQKTKDGYYFIYGNMITGDYVLCTKDFKQIDLENMIGNKNLVSFQGTIKNKSELKKIMKQLNIK